VQYHEIDQLLSEAQRAEDVGDFAFAIDRLQEAIRRDPTHAAAMVWVGSLFAQLDRFSEAEKILERAIAIDPTNSSAFSALGQVLTETGQLEKAELAYMQSIHWRPTASRYILLADVQGALGKDATAEISLRNALALDPDNDEALLNLGLILRVGDPNQACRLFRQAVAVDPLSAIANRELGFALTRTGQHSEAEHFLSTARQLDGDDPWTHLYLGGLFATLGRKQEAQFMYEESVRIAPLSTYFMQQYGEFLENNGEIERAIKCYRDAIAVDPSNPESAFVLGEALSNTGRVENARAWLRRALQLDPSHHAANALLTTLDQG
jgi:protein O-GlcNAc transferase